MSRTANAAYVACQPICLAGLVEVVRAAGFDVVATSDGTEDVVPEVLRCEAEMAVLDLTLSGVEVDHVLDELGGNGSRVRVVFGSHSPSGEEALEAVEGGAAGFLAFDSPLAELRDDLERTRSEPTTVSARFEHLVMDELRTRGEHADDRQLTPRQATVIAMVADGLSTAEIAERLSLSPLTVKAHYAGINEALDVSSKAAAVAAAFRRGLLS